MPQAAATGAVLAALDRGETHYTDRPGIMPLRRRIAELLTARFTPSPSKRRKSPHLRRDRSAVRDRPALARRGAALAAPAPAGIGGGRALAVRGAHDSTHLVSVELLYLARRRHPTMTSRLALASPPNASSSSKIDRRRRTFHPAQVAGFPDRVVTIGETRDRRRSCRCPLGYLAAPARRGGGLGISSRR